MLWTKESELAMTRMRATGACLSRCRTRRARTGASPPRPRKKKPWGTPEGPNGFGVNYPALYPVRGSTGLTGDLLGGAEVGEGSPVDGGAVGVADGGRGGSGGLDGAGFRLLRPRTNHRPGRPTTAWKPDVGVPSPHPHSPP